MDDEDDILYGKPDIDNLKSLLGRENQLLTAILDNKHIITNFQFEGFKMEDKKIYSGFPRWLFYSENNKKRIISCNNILKIYDNTNKKEIYIKRKKPLCRFCSNI